MKIEDLNWIINNLHRKQEAENLDSICRKHKLWRLKITGINKYIKI